MGGGGLFGSFFILYDASHIFLDILFMKFFALISRVRMFSTTTSWIRYCLNISKKHLVTIYMLFFFLRLGCLALAYIQRKNKKNKIQHKGPDAVELD